MVMTKFRSFFIPFVTLCLIFGVSAALIAFGRGYRLDFQKTQLTSTGLVSATSDPIGAQVLVEGSLKTATNNSFNLAPGRYTIRLAKDGYISWEKTLRIQAEVVTRVDAFLFPISPSLSPLSTTGVQNPTLSADGTKVAYTVPFPTQNARDGNRLKAGLWILELADRPLGRNRDPQQLAGSSEANDFSKAKLLWSPDSSQLLVIFDDTLTKRALLYQINRANNAIEVTSSLQSILADWDEEKQARDRQKLAAFPKEFVNLATSSAKIVTFSPDETKLLYEATAAAQLPEIIKPPLIGTNSTEEARSITPSKLYVYDSKEDKNFFLLDQKELPQPSPTPTSKKAASSSIQPTTYNLQPTTVFWFPTNRHLVVTFPGKIDVMEYDRTNWITIYSGPFIGGFVAPWNNGSRLVIVTNLNPDASTLPNFYTVNLR